MVRRSLQGPGHEPQKEVSITDASKVVEHPKKEDNMNYTKPEVLVLGSAKTVIESARQKTDNSQNDSVSPFTPPGPGPAYDLDE